MGLDVAVYQNVVKLDDDSEDYDFKAYVDYDGWKDRIKNLEEGACYTGDRVCTDIHYPYSAHTWLRNKLASLILDKEVEMFHEEDYEPGSPFEEFINFSDCEGTIDWETSAKLYQDFVDWRDRAREEYSSKDYNNETFLYRYDAWMEAFELAKENGVVSYC